MGLSRLTKVEQAQRTRAKALAQTAVRKRLATLLAEAGRPRSFLGANVPLAAFLPAQQAKSDDEAASGDDPLKDFHSGLLAITSREREFYVEYFNEGLISRQMADQLRGMASRIWDDLTSEGPEIYETAMYRAFRTPPSQTIWYWLHRRLGISGPLSDYLAMRLERLLVLDLAGRDIEIFVEDRLSGFIGAEGLAQVRHSLVQRREAVRGTLMTLELQYTQYLATLRDRQLSRMSLAMEAGEYRQQLAHALISTDVFEDLEVELAKRRARLETRPELDLGDRLRAMIAAVPIFETLPPEAISEISRMLSTRIVPPGTEIIREGEKGTTMYFLASGKLHVELETEGVLLSPGDYVGEMALLNDEPRSATVVSRSFAFMLELRRGDLRAIMRRYPAVREEIEARAAERALAQQA